MSNVFSMELIMRWNRLMFGVSLLTLSFIGHGEEAASHPLDAEAQYCVANYKAPVALANCYGDVVDEWRDEVERAYEFVIKRKSKQGKLKEVQLLQQEQNNWLHYRAMVASTWGKSCANNAPCQVELPKLELSAQRERYFQLVSYFDCINCFTPYDE
jgi:uncharacterized protein YecT (DUF1311 family)